MTHIRELINKIIPPADYQHRNGFSNDNIIDKLSDGDKNNVEIELINLLSNYNGDVLIVETLAYMNSHKSLDSLYKILNSVNTASDKIIIASSIYKISQDKAMVDISLNAIKTITDKYSLISLFYYLTNMQSNVINDYIAQFKSDSDYLLSYNAKRALGQLTE
jgi:hypothetical protein